MSQNIDNSNCTMFSLYTDVNDCANNPCLNNGLCVDGINTFTCTCATGFTGTICQTSKLCPDSQPSMGTCLGSRRYTSGRTCRSLKINFALHRGKISKLCSEKVIKWKSHKPDWVLASVTHPAQTRFLSNLNPCCGLTKWF